MRLQEIWQILGSPQLKEVTDIITGIIMPIILYVLSKPWGSTPLSKKKVSFAEVISFA